MSKPVILTGLRANNELHIGNYFGALLPIIDMSREYAGDYQINLFVPDLHSFTTEIDYKKLNKQILDNIRAFLACGLNTEHKDVHIYRQSYIPAHSELAWILNCFTGFGELNRMTQFKEKATLSDPKMRGLFISFIRNSYPDLFKQLANLVNAKDIKDIDDKIKNSLYEVFTEFEKHVNSLAKDRASIGLFDYPVLMAADILLYNTSYVPVGDDQTQHLEFTRDIAQRLNSKFDKNLFTVPVPVSEQHKFFNKEQGLRIRDLSDPTKKMSKSNDSDKGIIFLNDNPKKARKKILGATTDSFNDIQHNYESRPGISNLLDLLNLLGGSSEQYIGTFDYGALKMEIAEKIEILLNNFQSNLDQISDEAISEILKKSEMEMNEQANLTLLKVQKAVGLR